MIRLLFGMQDRYSSHGERVDSPNCTSLRANIARSTSNNTSFTVLPSAAYFPEPLPGDFNGVPTAPADGCFIVSSSITCGNISDTVFTDGTVGDETGSLMPTSFHAWSDSSGFSLSHSTARVRQVKLFFYHQPSMGIGLPQFALSASDSSIIPGTPSLQYTILGNQDLSEDDAAVRNVTLALTTSESNDNFYIQFSLTSEIQQFAVSEVELFSDEGNKSLNIAYVYLLIPPVSPIIQPLLMWRFSLSSCAVSHWLSQTSSCLPTQHSYHLLPTSAALWPTRAASSGSGPSRTPPAPPLCRSQMTRGAVL